jgi:hypothetical protein
MPFLIPCSSQNLNSETDRFWRRPQSFSHPHLSLYLLAVQQKTAKEREDQMRIVVQLLSHRISSTFPPIGG